MDNLNDLKAIWLTAKTDSLPTPAEMVRIIKKFRNQKLLKTVALLLFTLISVAAMVLVVFIYKSTMLTTRVGESFIILAGLILLITNLNTLNRFYKLRECSNKEFIQFLEHTKVRQLFYYKYTQVAAMSFAFVGLLLYLYEGVYKNTLLCIIIYAFAIIYFLVIWFVVRPRTFKKGTRKINEKLERLQEISKQL